MQNGPKGELLIGSFLVGKAEGGFPSEEGEGPSKPRYNSDIMHNNLTYGGDLIYLG